MAEIPEKFKDLFVGKVTFANLATIMADGTPQVTPVWFDYTDGKIRVNTARGRVKDKNMTRNPAVAISINDPENPYRYIQVRGHVVKSTTEGGDPHIDSLAKKYMGKDSYPFRTPTEVRVIYEIAIDSVQANG